MTKTPTMTGAMTGTILPLELRDVNFGVGRMRFLKDFTCTFEAGPRTMILGPNGAGKSLLMRICHGLIKPTTGGVVWRGANGTAPAIKQAMVFQRPVMLRRSVLANVLYPLSLGRFPKSEQSDRAMEALSRTGLKRLAHVSARVLSFGEQQKLALARVWALKPEVLFLDEPTASLDPSATHAIEEIIEAFHDAGTRIIMTTHDLGQAKRLGDEVLFLNRGRLLEKAPVAQFFEAPQNDLAQAFVRGELLWWKKKDK